MIKSTRNGYCDHVQKYKKLECLCWEEWRVGMGGWLQFGRGEVGWERRRRRRRRNRGRECRHRGYVYNGFYRWNHRRNVSVGDSDGESATSLYDYLGLNPSVKSSEKTLRHHTVASFQTNCIGRQRYGRYLPTGSPMELCRQYIPTELETKLFPSVRITDEKITSVISLVFAGFLVVIVH